MIKNNLLLLSAALALCACGGQDEDSGPSDTRGKLIGAPELQATLPATTLLAQLSGNSSTQLWLDVFGAPQCDVQSYHLRYSTVGGANEATDAATALMLPSGSAAACHGARPIVMYAHGTTTDRAYNIANLTDQSNAEGLIIAASFAAQGYIVVAPNYAGYDTSTLAYHPYLNADQQSKDMIDALTVARSVLPLPTASDTTDNGQLFITGYSQGGHVAMATQRAMQAAGMKVNATAPMSGPYAVAAFGDTVFEGEVDLGAPIFATLLITGYQKAYGNLYSDPGTVFEAQYASGISSLLPSTVTRSELYAQGKLPQTALFSSTPPDPAYASMTPATQPANLAAVFALGFGAGNLVTNSYRLSYLQDAQANPDGGWPTTTNAVPAAAPAHPLRRDFKLNDLRNWSPTAPVLLCGGDGDPTVFWLNTQLMQAYWAVAAPTISLTVLDVDSAASSNDPYASLKTKFSVTKQLIAANAVVNGATDGGASAVAQAYHGTLVPPFCLAAVKSFFAAH
jgi:hypothetical protein